MTTNLYILKLIHNVPLRNLSGIEFRITPTLTNDRFRYINQEPTPASLAYVGLSVPGEAGSWQDEKKVVL